MVRFATVDQVERRLVKYVGGEIVLVDDETGLSEPPRHHQLPLPAELSPADALRRLGGLAPGEALDRLGINGPLLASTNVGDSADSLFEAAFGRDSLAMASFLAPWHSNLRTATVCYWAERQGRVDPLSDHEEDGRIAHEYREKNDPRRAKLESQGMHFPNFESVDATPLWCVETLAAIEADSSLADRVITHIDGSQETLLKSLERSLRLMDRWRATNREGLIEAEAYAGQYQSFPYWKDSPDAYHHGDGALACPPVASLEVMAFAFEAYQGAARLASTRPDFPWDADELRRAANGLKEALVQHFWVDDDSGRYFALGTDRSPATGSPRALAVKTSNMGLLLDTSILDDDDMAVYRQAVIDQVFSPALLCPAGVRTLAADEIRFSPDSYHNGSVWPYDTFRIARGLAKFDPAGSQELLRRVLKACRVGFVEFLPGTDEEEPKPGESLIRVDTVNVYGRPIARSKAKVPQALQGWTAAAVYAAQRLIDDE